MLSPKRNVDEAGQNSQSEKIEQKNYTLKELREFDGSPEKPILIALNGVVYDVSSRRDLYGKGGCPYALFSGRDISRALAKSDLSGSCLPDTEYDDLTDLSEEERTNLNEWISSYEGKYFAVGKLVKE